MGGADRLTLLIAKRPFFCEILTVILELPELRAGQFGPDELRLELACALYARKKVTKVTAAALAGLDFFAFQHALKERGIPQYSEEMLDQDLRSMQEFK